MRKKMGKENNNIGNILQSLIENEYTYLSVIDINGKEMFKLKLENEHEKLKGVLDTIFDSGFTVKKIEKKDF